MPRVITMAVRTSACGSGSLISSVRRAPTIGASPRGPAGDRNSRLTPLPSRMKPISTRVRLRSSSR